MSEKQLFEEDKETKVNEYKFEPIKGYPMLYWRGKRPFTATQFYPAQLKEKYGEEQENWINKIFWGDNLQVMSHLLKEYRGKLKLIYIDPPYDSKADYKKKIKLRGKQIFNDSSSFEEKQYTDIWTNDEYLQFMYERLILLKELLAEDGSIYVHCDWRMNSYLRLIMDEIYGKDCFCNDINWTYQGSWVEPKTYFPRRSNTILFYKKNKSSNLFNIQYEENIEEQSIYKRWKNYAKNYKIYGKNAPYDDVKFKPYLDKFKKDNNRIPNDEDIILEFTGATVGDVWYISVINPISPEKLNYPTQKPEALLERIIKASSNPGDIVFDCFMGSGTTQAVAMKLGRKFIGADINLGAIQTTTKRLLNIQNELENNRILIDEEVKYTGFEVYNVNHYDFFRNEVEAKDLLIEALEIQKLDRNSIFDGEKDGRMVKIMPVNRIATKADITPFIASLDYKKYQKRAEESPSKPVEKIKIVCMGHEPDLQVAFENELKPLDFDVEIVDILRDKSNLEFKRDSEVEIKIEDGKLFIENFYPMNLLQKLSILKEDVEDWKELVESVIIDWNYDGAILEPKTVDIPEKNDLVKGVYKIPEDAGTIRVKITDLLSESLEWEVQNG